MMEEGETSTSTRPITVVDLCSPNTSDQKSPSQDKFIIRKRQSHLLPDFHEGLSAVGKSKKEKISVTNSRKPSSLEETGKECMEAEHKLEMNLLEDEHNQKLLFT